MNPELEDYFIPNERNKYAPHVLQKAAVVGMLFLVFLSFTIANVHSLLWIGSQWLVSTILPAVIVDLTNEEREAEALNTLHRSSVLDEAARMKAEHMAKYEYFAHYSPDGVSPWFWFGRAKYNFVHAGENLAIHFTDSGDVVEAWMESPTHRANIMNGNYTEIGVGTAEGTYEGYSTVYVVQLFGTPAAAPAPVAAATAPEETPLAVAAGEEHEEAVLAQSVSLSEEVSVFEAEPIAVPAEAEPLSPQKTAADERTASTTQETGQENNMLIADMESTPFGVALYSDHISTSTGGVPATINPDTDQKDKVPFFLKLATQPHAVLQILYVITGMFVLLSLIASIIIEMKRQHPIQIAYGTGLLAIMMLLYYVHLLVSKGALII